MHQSTNNQPAHQCSTKKTVCAQIKKVKQGKKKDGYLALSPSAAVCQAEPFFHSCRPGADRLCTEDLHRRYAIIPHCLHRRYAIRPHCLHRRYAIRPHCLYKQSVSTNRTVIPMWICHATSMAYMGHVALNSGAGTRRGDGQVQAIPLHSGLMACMP